MTEPFLFTPRTNIQEALELDDRVVQALQSLGLKCVDRRSEMCVAAAVETLADAALYHDIALDKILTTLNGLGLARKPADPAPDPGAP
ncbi:MAG TPA: DUF1858 domain-containing protein [Planctomycetota bacterium]|nr:DUF1858 domain-containing protein [Planctomycetota bacterium]